MSRHNRPVCVACHDNPVRDTTLCKPCVAGLERDLGDVGALMAEQLRIFTADDRDKGSDTEPLLRSRPRRLLPAVVERGGVAYCPLDTSTQGPLLVPEPLPAGAFGRSPSTQWDADHGLGREIDATVARQTATSGREGGRSSSRPLPFDDRAARVQHRVHNTLATWVRDLHGDTEPWPFDDVVAMAAWLLARSTRIAVHPAADQIERDVRGVVEQLRRAVDRPPDRWFMGPCDTPGCLEEHRLVSDTGEARVERRATELYADPGAETVCCPRCGAEYDITERRAWLLAAAEDQLAHAELIGRAAPALGIEITPAAVRGYANRGRIVEHSTDLQGRPLYRVGDVIAVAQDVLAKRASRPTGGQSQRSA